MSVFSSLFSRDPKAQFAYELPSFSFTNCNGISLGKSFKKADPAETATCFWESTNSYGSNYSLKLQAQKLKTMRHPNVLPYFDSIEIEDKFYFITESCIPLSLYMKETKFTNSQKEFMASWGFFQLMSCLKFLHNEAHLSHGSIRRSVYVTEGGDWKLGGFDKSGPFSNPGNDLKEVGFLLWEVFNGFDDNVTKPGPPGKIPRKLHELYKKCVTSQAARINASYLLDEGRRTGGSFKNRFVDTLLFLEEFQLKDSHDQQAFFSRLNDELDNFPEDVAKGKILPKLIQTYEYGDAGSHILLPLFKLGKLLNKDEYQKRIVPCLCKLFSSPDRVTRVKLLEKIDEFAPHLTSQVVNDKIYTNIACGFLDTNPAVREITVKAMVSLADKLNYHNLNTDLMKYLARLQGSDDQPGIRTNTTICLGKIGCYIDPSQRQRILVTAFTRALKDPFPPSRIAAILALSATQQYYSLIEVANKVLPSLAQLTCDPEKQVRDQVFKALKGFIEKLEKASENPEIIPELEAQVQAGGKGSLLNSDKVPQWASWALKSLSGKFYKSSPPPQANSSPAVEAAGQQSTSNTSSRNTPSTDKEQETKSDLRKATDSGSNNGWDDLTDDFEEGLDEGEQKLEPLSKKSSDEKSSWDYDDVDKILTETTLKPESNKKSVQSSESRLKTSKGRGGLKLQPAVKKSEEEDWEALFGVVAEPKNKITSNFPQSSTGISNKSASDLWSLDSGGDKWNDFTGSLDNPGHESSGWNVGWDDEFAEVKKGPKEDSRRTENAARNEVKRKQLASRRAAKGTGAVRLGSAKPS